jgi:N-acetylglutamate synthase-like GNAT family acetyltransferase
MRRARSTDAAAIKELVQAAYGHYPERIGGRPRPMDDDYEHEIEINEVWVLPDEGDIAGVIVLVVGDGHLFVGNVAVAPSAQAAGRGRELLAHADARAAELGLPELRLMTHGLMSENQAIYEYLGWERMATPAEHAEWAVYYRKEVDCRRLGD